MKHHAASSTVVDAHAHVFMKNLPLTPGMRYTPSGDAPPEAYSALLSRYHISGGVLVQPSFLGTNNTYLLNTLAALRRRKNPPFFCGICVIPPATAMEEIRRLKALGIIGARLNLIGRKIPALHTPQWRTFLSALHEANWHLEIHIEGPRLPKILKDALPCCPNIVIDHFGLPDPAAPLKCRGFKALLASPPGQLRVKISAPYRVFPALPVQDAAAQCAVLSRALREQLGEQHLLWGSDWPWTRHEKNMDYETTRQWREQWLNGKQDGSAALLSEARL